MPASNDFDHRRWWNREDLILLVLLGIFFYVPGIYNIPLFDRDEPRFAVAARTMAQSRDFIVPHYNGMLRPDKPPLVYWLMDLGYAITGSFSELGARLPSATCGTLTLLIVYFMTGRRFGRVTGILASIMLGSSVLFVVESRLATADATMVLFIAICMAIAWRAWDGVAGDGAPGTPAPARLPRADYLPDRTGQHTMLMLDQLAGTSASARLSFPLAMCFWIALAAGTLAKGVPLAFVLIPLITLAILTAIRSRNWQWWRQLRPLIGVPLLIALVGWWVMLAGVQTHWRLIFDMVGNHFLNRFAGPLLHWMHIHIPDTTPGGTQDAMKTYSEPPGFFLATIWGTFWPWSVLLVPAGFHATRRLRSKGPVPIDPRPYQFLIAWIIPMWILLELSRGKLLHYPLPLFIPIAILCADTLTQSWHRLTDVLAAPWFSAMRWITLLIWLGLGFALLFAARHFLDRDLFWHVFPFGIALIATGFVNAVTWGRHSWPFVLALCWGGSLLVAGTLVLPSLPQLQVSIIAADVMKYYREAHPQYKQGVCDYEDATLVFYSGENVQTFGDPQTLIKNVPFAPARDPAADPYLLVVDDATIHLLDKEGLTYVRLPRRDSNPATPAFSIYGVRGGNFKPVAVTVITNIYLPTTAGPASAPALQH